MHEFEEKRVLDKAHKGEDLQELQREEDVDATPGKLLPEYVDEFHRVTAAMESALGAKPEQEFHQELTPIQRQAMEALYMAKSGKHVETGEFISAIERSDLLNQALIYLQPILALGLRIDFKEGRPRYDQLVDMVTETKAEISSAIRSQIMKKPKKKKKDKAEEQDPGGPRDADADAPAGDEDQDDSAKDSMDDSAKDSMDDSAKDSMGDSAKNSVAATGEQARGKATSEGEQGQ